MGVVCRALRSEPLWRKNRADFVNIRANQSASAKAAARNYPLVKFFVACALTSVSLQSAPLRWRTRPPCMKEIPLMHCSYTLTID